jgi:dipeptidyl aminopeptidase/acylaminoacyl peptidase
MAAPPTAKPDGRRPLEPEDLFRLRLCGGVAIVPGSDVVFYVEKKARREDNDYRSRIMRVAPGEPPAAFTQGPDDHSPKVSPDGQWLAFLGKRGPSTQIWLMDLKTGGEARQLTDVAGGVEELTWRPDSAALAFVAWLDEQGIESEAARQERLKVEDEDPFVRHTRGVKVIQEALHKLDGQGWYTKRRKQVAVIGIEPGARPVQLTEPPYSHSGVSWTPDGSQVVFLGKRSADYDSAIEQEVFVAAADGTGVPRKLVESPGLDVSAARISPDGTQVALLATRPDEIGYDNQRLYLSAWDDPEAPRVVAGDWDRPFADVSVHDMPAPAGGGMTWSPDSQSIYSLTSVDGAVQLARVNVGSGVVTLLTQADQVHHSYSVDPARGIAVLAATAPLDPSRVLRLNMATGDVTELATPNREVLADIALSEPRRFEARAEDGPALDGFLMEPVNREPGRRYPAILEIHGGPMMMYAQAFFLEFQWLAANGWGVVYSNPRGSQGYGFEFCRAIQKEWGNRDYADLMAALDVALREAPSIDPDRLGVAGGSYGGYMTNWIIGHTDRFKAAVTMRSVADWRGMVGSGDLGARWIRRPGVAPWVDDTWYRQQSPITYVENIVTPLLIEHQEGDLRCPIGQGEMLYTAVKHVGKAPVKFVRYPNEFHGMSRNGKPWHRVHRLRELAGWFTQYLEASSRGTGQESSALDRS